MRVEQSRINTWLNDNCLTLNVSKTQFVVFRRKQKRVEDQRVLIKMNNVVVGRESCVKFLGVQVDENLLWSMHIDCVVKKISKFVPIIHRIRSRMDMRTLKLMYNSIIYPNLVYCNSVWGGTCKSRLDILLKCQKRIVRTISYCGARDSCAPLFKSLNFLPLNQINVYINVLYVFKSLLSADGNFNLYESNAYVTRLSNTRSVIIPNILSSHSRQSSRWIGGQQWNGLPQALRDVTQYDNFKLSLKRHLLADL